MGIVKKNTAKMSSRMMIDNNLHNDGQPNIHMSQNSEASKDSQEPCPQADSPYAPQPYSGRGYYSPQSSPQLRQQGQPSFSQHSVLQTLNTQRQLPQAPPSLASQDKSVHQDKAPFSKSIPQKAGVRIESEIQAFAAKRPEIDTDANTKLYNGFLMKKDRLNTLFKRTGLLCPNGQRVEIATNEANFFYIVGDTPANETIDIYPAENAFSTIGRTYISNIFDITEKAGQNKVIKPARALLTNFGYYQVKTKGHVEFA